MWFFFFFYKTGLIFHKFSARLQPQNVLKFHLFPGAVRKTKRLAPYMYYTPGCIRGVLPSLSVELRVSVKFQPEKLSVYNNEAQPELVLKICSACGGGL